MAADSNRRTGVIPCPITFHGKNKIVCCMEVGYMLIYDEKTDERREALILCPLYGEFPKEESHQLDSQNVETYAMDNDGKRLLTWEGVYAQNIHLY